MKRNQLCSLLSGAEWAATWLRMSTKKKKMQSETERSGFSGPFNAFPKTSKATAIAPDKLLAWDPEVAAGAFGSMALCSNHLYIPARRVSPLVLPFPFPTSALLINQKSFKLVCWWICGGRVWIVTHIGQGGDCNSCFHFCLWPF